MADLDELEGQTDISPFLVTGWSVKSSMMWKNHWPKSLWLTLNSASPV